MKICVNCNAQITETSNLIEKARKLERLFTGLSQESDADLTIVRLNCYRAHFSLPEQIVEQQSFELYEDSEVHQESLEETEIIEETYEEEEIIENVGEEIYLEETKFETEEPAFIHEEVIKVEKSEDEKFFNFLCHVCEDNNEFPTMKLLTNHCQTVHNCLPLVKCCSESCGATLSTWRRLLIHKEKHFPSGNSKFRCKICSRVYVSETAFAKHIESHSIRHFCSHCGKDFKEQKTLKLHEEAHLFSVEMRRTHCCKQVGCDMKFISKQAMENHFK
jgi:hypothetical protein